jgi:hypothetical protein
VLPFLYSGICITGPASICIAESALQIYSIVIYIVARTFRRVVACGCAFGRFEQLLLGHYAVLYFYAAVATI